MSVLNPPDPLLRLQRVKANGGIIVRTKNSFGLEIIFKLITGATLLLISTGSCATTRTLRMNADPQNLAIIQGATTSQSVQLAVLVSQDSKFQYKLTDTNGHNYREQSLTRRTHPSSAWAVDQLYFENLPEETLFQLEVRTLDKKTLIDQRYLKTFPKNPKAIRLALASCMADSPRIQHEKIWSSFRDQNPDLVFFLGDNVYAAMKEPIDPSKMWQRYVETRNSLEFYHFKNLIPVFATWDDHDFGQNNGDKTYAYTQQAQQIFRDFFPQSPIKGVLSHGPGISFSLELFKQSFVFLDDRSFRDKPQGLSMWGTTQEDWLTERLRQNSHQPLWIINGSQIFGQYGPSESLEKDFPNHFERLLQQVRSTQRRVTFVSGDIHASEVMRLPMSLLGQETLEITSSSMHSFHKGPGALRPNPRRLAGYDGDNFIIVTMTLDSASTPFYLEAFNRDNQKVFTVNPEQK